MRSPFAVTQSATHLELKRSSVADLFRACGEYIFRWSCAACSAHMHTCTRLPPIMNKHDPLEQDNNKGINGVPGFSWFFNISQIMSGKTLEHHTKVTVGIMQSHNATDLSNNIDIESEQTNVRPYNIWNTKRNQFTPVNQRGNNDGQPRINRPQLNFGIPNRPPSAPGRLSHVTMVWAAGIRRFILFQPLLSPPHLETSLFVLAASAQGKCFVRPHNLFLCNEYVYVAMPHSLQCTKTWHSRCLTMFSVRAWSASYCLFVLTFFKIAGLVIVIVVILLQLEQKAQVILTCPDYA